MRAAQPRPHGPSPDALRALLAYGRRAGRCFSATPDTLVASTPDGTEVWRIQLPALIGPRVVRALDELIAIVIAE